MQREGFWALFLQASLLPASHTCSILVSECSALWASGSNPADALADVSMHTARVGECATLFTEVNG